MSDVCKFWQGYATLHHRNEWTDVKFVAENFAIVVVGAFNPAILVPEWIARHALGHPAGQEFPVEMLAPVSPGGATTYTFLNFSVQPTFRAVKFFLTKTPSTEYVSKIQAIGRIFEALPHTPVGGLGFNVRYECDQENEPLASLLSTDLELADVFPGGAEAVVKRWSNVFHWGDAQVTVLGEKIGPGNATIDFNFHYEVANAAAAVELLSDEAFCQKHLDAARAAATHLSGENVTEEQNEN